MATLLVTVPEGSGHSLPMLPIVEALVKRGHRVLVHTSANNYAKVQAIGAEVVPMTEPCNFVSRLKTSSVRRPWWLPAVAKGFWQFRHEVLTMIPCMVTELEAIIQQERVDCLVADFIGFGAAYAAERCDIPFVTISVTWIGAFNAHTLPAGFSYLPLPPWLIHAITNFIFPLRRIRQQMGLPPRSKKAPSEFMTVMVSKLLNVVTFYREFVPSKQLQANQVFVGSTAFQMPRATDDSPYGANLDPNTVLVSTTTSAVADDGQFRQVLEPVAQMGIPVLAASGVATDIPVGLGNNVRLETFVPFDEVLPYVRAMVTHGGAGSVGKALKFGVPMLIISGVGDSAATGARAAELGLAYHLHRSKATPQAIQAKLAALLEDDVLRRRVKAFAEKIHAMDSPALAANAIEGTLYTSMQSNRRLKSLLH
ncbi:glycosyltransferase family 1 protein [Oculatella sp. LEGE 06141]|uniref:glycosyltransferase n=1 Tax=Oculatella sp. LEGE 06141 TaxID=1828648 RepID=UPI00187E58D8|nr:glycosyltransferase [Oculatella sp. LEGE 06141]MBE9181920.1 glycosyltransferase family 1 protein [Oculatella sp. LEGE 06141]